MSTLSTSDSANKSIPLLTMTKLLMPISCEHPKFQAIRIKSQFWKCGSFSFSMAIIVLISLKQIGLPEKQISEENVIDNIKSRYLLQMRSILLVATTATQVGTHSPLVHDEYWWHRWNYARRWSRRAVRNTTAEKGELHILSCAVAAMNWYRFGFPLQPTEHSGHLYEWQRASNHAPSWPSLPQTHKSSSSPKEFSLFTNDLGHISAHPNRLGPGPQVAPSVWGICKALLVVSLVCSPMAAVAACASQQGCEWER